MGGTASPGSFPPMSSISVNGTKAWNLPLGVAVDLYGNVYVSDREGGSSRKGAISRVSATTGAIDILVTSIGMPDFVAVDDKQNLYVTNIPPMDRDRWMPGACTVSCAGLWFVSSNRTIGDKL